MRLEGKTALVTGGASGFGAGIVRKFLAEGARVAIADINAEAANDFAAGLGDQAFAVAVDVSRNDSVAAMAKTVLDRFGGLDILVNNAVLSPWRSIDDTDETLFMKAMEVNMRGNWYLSVEATKLMKPRGGGSIVNISSVAALHPDKMLALYSTFKTAMIGMSRSFALEYGEFGIRVNTILPGLIDTKLAKAFEGEEMTKILEGTPLRRIGRPEEIGFAVLYLSSAAGAFTTGASLVIDGGASIASH